jgi:hypothetical protein
VSRERNGALPGWTLVAFCLALTASGCGELQPGSVEPGAVVEETAPGSDEVVDLGVLSRRAYEAKAKEDWTTAREIYLEAIEVAGNHPAIHQRLAEVEIRLGRLDAAVENLAAMATLGGTTALGPETPFASLEEQPGFADVAARIRANGEPFESAMVVVTFEDPELFPEGIAWDSDSGDLFVGSYTRNKIVRISPDGSVSDLGTSAKDGLGAVLGLWVDVPRRELWAVSGSRSMEEMTHPAELVRYQVDTGHLLGRYAVAETEEVLLINDVVVTPDGTAWATESLRGGLYRVPPGGEELERFRSLEGLGFANGIAASDDGSTLYVAHAEGVSAIDPVTGKIERLTAQGDFTLVSADGLSWADGALILVQNQPTLNNRVVRVALDSTGRRALDLDILPAGMPAGLDPYTSAWAGGRVYIVASAPFDTEGTDVRISPPAIVSVPISYPSPSGT